MKKLWLLVSLFLLSGCITTGTTSQVRGLANGVEYRSIGVDGVETIINVSGDAKLVSSPDGSLEITSKGNVNDILKAAGILP